jgi:hypothetical protein
VHPLQEQVREWYVQAFAKIQEGTTGAIALADEAEGVEAASDEGTDTSQDLRGKQQKVLLTLTQWFWIFPGAHTPEPLPRVSAGLQSAAKAQYLFARVHRKMY